MMSQSSMLATTPWGPSSIIVFNDFYGDIPHDITASTLLDTINTDSINEKSDFNQLPVTVTVCISVNIYCCKPYLSLCYSFLAFQGHNNYKEIYYNRYLDCHMMHTF